MGFGIWQVYESHRKVIFLQTTVYRVECEEFSIHVLYKKSHIKMYIDLFNLLCSYMISSWTMFYCQQIPSLLRNKNTAKDWSFFCIGVYAKFRWCIEENMRDRKLVISKPFKQNTVICYHHYIASYTSLELIFIERLFTIQFISM